MPGAGVGHAKSNLVVGLRVFWALRLGPSTAVMAAAIWTWFTLEDWRAEVSTVAVTLSLGGLPPLALVLRTQKVLDRIPAWFWTALECSSLTGFAAVWLTRPARWPCLVRATPTPVCVVTVSADRRLFTYH